jgi:hypothetical protein
MIAAAATVTILPTSSLIMRGIADQRHKTSDFVYETR